MQSKPLPLPILLSAISSFNLINDPPSCAGPFIKTVTTDGFPQVNSYLQPTVNSGIQTELWTCVQSAVFTKTIRNLSTEILSRSRLAQIKLFSHWKSFSLGFAMPRTLHTLLVAAQEGDPQRVILEFKICSIVVDIVMFI